MVGQMDRNSAWSQIVASLSRGGRHYAHTSLVKERNTKRRGPDVHWPRDVKIRILDRLTSSTISVAWAHPCSGNSGLQTWRRALARKSEICALSGEPVIRGQEIYRLARSVRSQCYVDEVLLASRVDAILDRQNDGLLNDRRQQSCAPEQRARKVFPAVRNEVSAT
ncbi:DUF3331 domain-containing protein [Paraburkholderia sp. BL25I1N1]|uniref:DUF3331 domain-containing protein n=1 Tax=Paraburkholderia sp. BL25I1N1 TaxID=1938804 RepID=UPI000D07C833